MLNMDLLEEYLRQSRWTPKLRKSVEKQIDRQNTCDCDIISVWNNGHNKNCPEG